MSLDMFSPPGFNNDLTDDGRRRWSKYLSRLMTDGTVGDARVPNDSPRPQFFNLLGADLDADATTRVMKWGAFPRKLARVAAPRRWKQGHNRDLQEEYCEWAAVFDRKGRITRAFFTTEVGSYFHLLASDDPDRLLEIYRKEVSPEVEPDDLFGAAGHYLERNPWNLQGAMHMIQINNTLAAAIQLVAQSTIVRKGPAGPLANADDLIPCGVSADPDRNSDPLIVAEVNGLARRGSEITLADPVGLYLDSLQSAGWLTPDGTDPHSFWTVTRGDADNAVRAVYAVPPELEYTVTDITINGQPIVSPSQIAEAIQVKVVGLAHRFGQADVSPRGCRDERPIGAAEGELGLAAESPSVESLLAAARDTR